MSRNPKSQAPNSKEISNEENPKRRERRAGWGSESEIWDLPPSPAIWDFFHPMIQTDAQLAELLPKLETVDRVAVDTEADSLHCYFEKLCLVQISVPGHDYLVDPLSQVDLAPLATALTPKELVLQGADFDLRLLRRTLGFVATRVFDTVIAARLLGIRSFSLAALVERYFGVT